MKTLRCSYILCSCADQKTSIHSTQTLYYSHSSFLNILQTSPVLAAAKQPLKIMDSLPVDHFVTSQAFTKVTYRDVYSAIDPSIATNSQTGKVIVITGASKGIGRIVSVTSCSTSFTQLINSSLLLLPLQRPVLRASFLSPDQQTHSLKSSKRSMQSTAR